MLLLGDSAKVLKDFNNNVIDLTITSPPYDAYRTYGSEDGHLFDFATIARELYRVTKIGGVIVWVIGDQTNNGDESGSSFRQALFFKELGFKLHDTMIWLKRGFLMPSSNRYHQVFEYMFIFVKGKRPKTFNPINDRRNKDIGGDNQDHYRTQDGELVYSGRSWKTQEFGRRYNVWTIPTHFNARDRMSHEHPAIFPSNLVRDHLLSWSEEGDLILDPFCGSGTTCLMADKLKRKWIGIEMNPNYIETAKMRLMGGSEILAEAAKLERISF